MINAILIDPADSVATVLTEVSAGTEVAFVCEEETVRVTALQNIPRYHKIAVRDMAHGERVIKYGESIGLATKPIRTGEHVHTQNLSSDGR
jgi:altronate dehydratase small subunit